MTPRWRRLRNGAAASAQTAAQIADVVKPSPPPSRTSISTIYIGQSGLHYAYTSSSDLNGDGVTSNDPIYIPTGPSDPKSPAFASAWRISSSG